MRRFLDLNYYFIDIKDPKHILIRHNANLGYLKYLTSSMKVTVLNNIRVNKKFSSNEIDYIFHKKKLFWKFNKPFSYYNIIKKYNPEYILIHGLRYGLYSFILKYILLKKTLIVVQVHGYAPAPNGFKKTLYKWANKYIDGYFFTGKVNAQSWIDGGVFKEDKVFEIMEGSTDFKFMAEQKRTPQSFIWVGRLDKNKDPLTILTAFNEFLLHAPNARLTMVYNSFELLYEVKSFINSDDRLLESVELIGEVAHSDLELLYNKHKYFILGSHFEGSGYALVEAMSCGCVPIVTKIPSFEFMTNRGACAFLFTPGNSGELTEVLKKTLLINYKDEQLKVLKRVKNKLSYEAIANDVANCFYVLEKSMNE